MHVSGVWLEYGCFPLTALFLFMSPLASVMGSLLHLRGFPRVTSVLAIAKPPGCPGGVYDSPPVGSCTRRDRTAARLPQHGSRAMGLGLTFFFIFSVLRLSSKSDDRLSGDVAFGMILLALLLKDFILALLVAFVTASELRQEMAVVVALGMAPFVTITQQLLVRVVVVVVPVVEVVVGEVSPFSKTSVSAPLGYNSRRIGRNGREAIASISTSKRCLLV